MKDFYIRSIKYFLITLSIFYTIMSIKAYDIVYMPEYKLDSLIVSVLMTSYTSRFILILSLSIALTINFSNKIKTLKNKILKHCILISISCGIISFLLCDIILPEMYKEGFTRSLNIKMGKSISLQEERINRKDSYNNLYYLQNINFIRKKLDTISDKIDLQYSKIDSIKLNISNQYLNEKFSYSKGADIEKFKLKEGLKNPAENQRKIASELKAEINHTKRIETQFNKAKWTIIDRIYFIILALITPFISLLLASKFYDQNEISLIAISLLLTSFLYLISTDIKGYIIDKQFLSLILSIIISILLIVFLTKYKTKKL